MIPAGIYRIVSAIDTNYVVDIEGAAKTNAANAQLYVSNGTNAQHFEVSSDATSNAFACCASGKMLDAAGGGTTIGTNVQQWDSNGTAAQRWEVVADGKTLTVNGTSYPTYAIKSKLSNLVWDAQWGAAKNSTNIWLYPANNSAAQRWAFVPDAALSDKLSIPASLGFAEGDASTVSILFDASSTALHPRFRCRNQDGYLFRRRMREKQANKGWGAWGAWASIDGSTVNDGWGALSAAAIVGNDSEGWVDVLLDMPVASTHAIEQRQWELSVRALDLTDTYLPTVGNIASATVTGTFKPSLLTSTITLHPDGVHIVYASDWVRGNNTVSVSSIKVSDKELLARSCVCTGMPASGVLVIPWSSLTFTPANNVEITASTLKLTTDIGATASCSLAGKQIPWSSDMVVNVAIADPAEGIGWTRLVEVTTTDLNNNPVACTCECTLRFEKDGEAYAVACDTDTAGRFVALPPFDVAWSIAVSARNTSGVWGLAERHGETLYAPGCVWNFEGDFAVIAVGAGSSPSIGYSLERNHSAAFMSGRKYESVLFGEGFARDINVSGAIIEGDPVAIGDTRRSMSRLEACGYAVFRAGRGRWSDVAIIGVSESKATSAIAEFSVKMKERS